MFSKATLCGILTRSALFFTVLLACDRIASAQFPPGQPNNNPGVGTTIQLPSIGIFGVQTVVSVPDGGTMFLGGNSGYAGGRTSRGVPGLSNVPYLGRPFRNQGIGYGTTARGTTAQAKIIIMDELEQDVMREATARAALRRGSDPNGSLRVQKKADFLSRHMGKKKR